jgi:hypothetical protein
VDKGGSAETSAAVVAAQQELRATTTLGKLGKREEIAYELRAGKENIWLIARQGAKDLLALRSGLGGGAIEGEPVLTASDDGHVCEWNTALGAMRLKIAFPHTSTSVIRATLSLLPASDVRLSSSTRDLFFFAPEGKVHTTQRGLRTGIFFASCEQPRAFSVMYVQDFSSLTDFFDATDSSPAGTVGGNLREAGYLAPSGDACVLPKSREFVISDVYLTVGPDVPHQRQLGGGYLDLLADIYLCLSRPALDYRDWPGRAARTMRDLTLSPACTYERGGQRFLMPYVGDTKKPPESMVQLTVLLNAIEYEQWRGTNSRFTRMLSDGVERFFEPGIGTVVRWLPGEDFGDQAEENMNHAAMDSWYLYHSLFNVARLATMGNMVARRMFRDSLPFAIRVARRFDYRWPIFFNLKTLDIIRAESNPGEGGENDVTGLYALVMLHAHELFGDEEYLEEAKRGADLCNAAFDYGYQMNTTAYGAEATLRLWLKTKDRKYLELSEMCLANIFDNMWLWRCDYGRAKYYRTFFGMFPLHDAPYLAAYEEVEMQAKFHEYVRMGGSDIRPSLRLLLAEYQKHSLDRCWFYYPDALPLDSLSDKVRNGRIERTLSIPLEDLQDGRTPSGAVGQEVYGAGLPFVYTSRHYMRLPEANAILYCEYALCDYAAKTHAGSVVITFRTAGDRRIDCELRMISLNAEQPMGAVTVTHRGKTGAVKPRVTVEGHIAFRLDGHTEYEVKINRVSMAVARKQKPAAKKHATTRAMA